MSEAESQPLYKAQEPVFPRKVYGFYRNLKWWLMALTLGIYYITPWIRWDRGPEMPGQAVLVDLANRRFFFFWIEIWPHEFYFVAGLLIMAGLGLFLFTSALGRVWCGYACPQTVWTDLFILVERWIEGDRNARVRLRKQKYDFRKFRLRITKWTAWLLISIATGGAWVFYFADAPTLFVNLFTGNAAFVAYSSVAVLAFTTFTFGGFMREQICIYMCPWPRIQAAMMDKDTLTVAYRDWRGEPRGKHRKQEGADQLGDCIDCNACVNVCPMGIDIRDGQQLECITCALCIDACDDVMAKIGKPRGLIDYLALKDEPLEREGMAPRPLWQHVMRLRTIVYFVLWSLFGVAMVVALFVRSDMDISATPVRNPVFITLSDGSIRNVYDIRVRNQSTSARGFEISVGDDFDVEIEIQGLRGTQFAVDPDALASYRLYLTADPDSAAARSEVTKLRIWLDDTSSTKRDYVDTVFNGRGE